MAYGNKSIHIIQLKQEITSIISPPYFLRSQNVGFRKHIFISYPIISDRIEYGRLEFSIHKDLKRQGKYICGKLPSKKYSIISEQRCAWKTSWPTLKKEAAKYSERLATNYQGTCLHIPEDCKLHHQQRENLKPKAPRLVILWCYLLIPT